MGDADAVGSLLAADPGLGLAWAGTAWLACAAAGDAGLRAGALGAVAAAFLTPGRGVSACAVFVQAALLPKV